MNMMHRAFIAENAKLEDHWAERVVDRMIAPMRAHDDAIYADLKAFLRADRGHGVGSKAGFLKWVERLHKRTARNLLAHVAVPRSRMRSLYVEDRWAPQPDFTAIVGHRVAMIGKGPHRDSDTHEFTVCSFTRHALTRLVQRAGCTTPSCLHGAVQAAWPTVSTICTASFVADVRNVAGGWAAPFTYKGRDIAVIVVRSDRGDTVGYDAVTVLDQKLMDAESRERLAEFAGLIESMGKQALEFQAFHKELMETFGKILRSIEIAHPTKYAAMR